MRLYVNYLSILILLHVIPASSNAQQRIEVPMQAEQWDTAGVAVEFLPYKSVPAMRLKDGPRILLQDVEFSNGTIEFDTEFGDARFVGIYFRQQEENECEWLYLRCYRAGNPYGYDAIQYASIVKGVTLWDLQPQYQGPADFRKNEWNHVKLIISGDRMRVFVNDMDHPVLDIGKLEGNTRSGSIGLLGNAYFANLVIRPEVTEGLPSEATIDPTYNDPNYLRKWQVTEPELLPFGEDVIGRPLPDKETSFSDISAERYGLINLTRKLGKDANNQRRIVWVKTTIQSESNQTKKLDLGFSDEVWVFINRDLLYLDKNYYNSAIMKPPHGRISIENTSIDIPLREGDNELLIAVGNNFFGWGIMARLENLDGIRFP